MSAAQQAKARRRQMANNMAHLAPRKRPNYKRRDAATAARRLAALVAKENTMRTRKGKKSK